MTDTPEYIDEIAPPTEAELSELHDILTEFGLPKSGLSERQQEVLISALEQALEAIWEAPEDQDFGPLSVKVVEAILVDLGIGFDGSHDPGADRRRDRLCRLIDPLLPAALAAPPCGTSGVVDHEEPKGSAADLTACAQIARRNGDNDTAERFEAAAARIKVLEAEANHWRILANKRALEAAEHRTRANALGDKVHALEAVLKAQSDVLVRAEKAEAALRAVSEHETAMARFDPETHDMIVACARPVQAGGE